jgi:hypothetical protein
MGTGGLLTACGAHAATVLVTSSTAPLLTGQDHSPAEIFNPATGTFTQTTDMATPRESH